MKNKKLHLTLELLSELDTIQATTDIGDAFALIEIQMQRITSMQSNYPKEHIFHKLLDFIWNSYYIYKEDLFSELEKQKGGDL